MTRPETENPDEALTDDELEIVGYVLRAGRPLTATVIAMNVQRTTAAVVAALTHAQALGLVETETQPGAKLLSWVAGGRKPSRSLPPKSAPVAKDSTMPVEAATVYRLGQLTLVPHYTQPGTWVAPGGALFSAAQLALKGATAATAMLWPRTWAA